MAGEHIRNDEVASHHASLSPTSRDVPEARSAEEQGSIRK
jgi:hypothetical protein